MEIFEYDSETGDITVNKAELLLIREFAALWDTERNKMKGDANGYKRKRAKKELAFIKLFFDWTSPYAEYQEQERFKECMMDAGLTEEDLKDETFKAACRKYVEIQESPIAIRLVKSARRSVEQLIIYFNTLDLTERDKETNKPIYKAKDVMKEISSVSEIFTELEEQEEMLKKKLEAGDDVRGGVDLGYGEDI